MKVRRKRTLTLRQHQMWIGIRLPISLRNQAESCLRTYVPRGAVRLAEGKESLSLSVTTGTDRNIAYRRSTIPIQKFKNLVRGGLSQPLTITPFPAGAREIGRAHV